MSKPLVLACLFALSASALAQAVAHVPQEQAPVSTRGVIQPELQQAMLAALPGARLPAYLVMTSQLTPQDLESSTRGLHGREQRHAVAAALQAHANSTQGAARAALQEAVAADRAGDVHLLWMGNAIVFTAEAAVIEQLARLPGIDRMRLIVDHGAAAYQDALPTLADGGLAAAPARGDGSAPPEPNLVQLQAPQLWDVGVTGAGVLLGTLDGGVWWTHPDLIHRIWSNPGEIPANNIDDDGNGKIDDVHGWDFASNGPDVTSFDSHGTKTAGIAVGDGGGGVRTTGMAPGATLLACEVYTEAQYWLAQQYCLEMGVDAITSSYGYKWYFNPKPDFHMHRQLCTMELAAGIIHANSIGNAALELDTQPVPFNISAPGNCPSPFNHPQAVHGGATSVVGCGGILLDDGPYALSSHGPSAWENMQLYSPSWPWSQNDAYWDYPFGGFGGPGPGLLKPDVVAYSEGIWTTTIGLGSAYWTLSGTSAAAPHVGGAFCLLRQVQPAAQPRHVSAALEATAVDLGDPGKDTLFGSGKIQVFDAARRLRVLGTFDDTTPGLGDPLTLTVRGYPSALVYGWFGLNLFIGDADFNLAPPYFSLGVFPLGPSGQSSITAVVPTKAFLLGLTVWFEFAAKPEPASLWGSGPLISVPESITIGG